MSEEIEFHGWLVSEEIEFHGWLGKKKVPSSPPGVFFWNSPQAVAEKSLTEKKFTDRQTDIVTEKAKTIYSLYTSYRGYNN